MSRQCKACDGRGYNDAMYYSAAVVRGTVCAACGGSGVVEERIPAADALADAETLRANSSYVLASDVPDEPRAAERWARIAFWTVPGLR